METKQQNPQAANYVCQAVQAMQRGWEIVRDVAAGTLRLRELAEKYLPSEEGEQRNEYAIRLRRAVFFNAFERTLHALVGLVFAKEPVLGDDVPERIRGTVNRDAQELGLLRGLVRALFGVKPEPEADQGAGWWAKLTGLKARYEEFLAQPQALKTAAPVEGYAKDIDGQGTHWAVFAKAVFLDALRDGHALIYVDAPPKLTSGANAAGVPTKADARAANIRPFWVKYTADQLINWRTDARGRLTLVVFRETGLAPEGAFGEKTVTHYRVLTPGAWALYVERKNDQGTTVIELARDADGQPAQGATSLPLIPIAPVYARKTGLFCSQPPLLDLALLNLAHFQKYSDFSIYLHICKPLLWFRGRKKPPGQERLPDIGPYSYVDVEKDGTVDFAEPTGAALAACASDLKDLEHRMSVLGLSLLVKNTQQATATEELLDTARESSDLATAARSLKDGLELALYFMAFYEDKTAPTGGTVQLGSALADLALTAQDVQVYSQMVAQGQLTAETLWQVLQKGGRLPADFDAQAERAALETQREQQREQQAALLNRGVLPGLD